MRIAECEPEVFGGDDAKFDRLADRAPQQIGHSAEKEVGIRGLGIERLPPRESEQAMRQCSRPFGRLHRGFHVTGHAVHLSFGDPPSHQI